MFHLASFSRGRDMRHRNAPTWLRGPHNSWAHRAAVRMTPCVLADRTVLHIKLVPTNCSMVDSPCPDVASHISLAKWTPVNDAFLRRPRPWPRQGRRLGPPQVWNLSFLAPPNPPNPLNPLNPQNVKTLATFSQQASRGLPPTQATATPRPDPLLLPRPPGLRSQQASQGHIHGFLWASKLAVCQPLNAPNPPNPLNPQNVKTLATFSQQASRGLPPTQATATPRPDPLLLPRPPGLRSQQASQGHIHGFLWASKLAVCQPLNAPNPPNPLNPQNVKTLATFSQQASRGLPPTQATATPRPDPLLLPRPPGLRSQQASQGHIHGFLWASKLAVCQPLNAPNPPNPLNPQNVKTLATFSQQASRGLPPTQATATPRPDPLLLPRPPGLRSQQASQGHIHGFLWASKLAVCQPLNAPNPPNPLNPQNVKTLATFSQQASRGLPPTQATATPRPDPLLLPRPPGLRSQQASQGHIHGFLWASKLAVCQPLNAPNPPNPLNPQNVKTLATFSQQASRGLPPTQATATPRPDPLLLPRPPGLRSQQASQGHIHGFLWASKLAVCQPRNAPNPPNPPNPLNPKTSKPLQPSANRRPEACLQRRPQRPHGQIHCFFQGRQAFAANRRPKATSMASYGRPSLPFANAGHSDPTARPIASSKAARPSQPTGVPRPHPWLLMGVQACRLPAPKRSKPSKPSQPPKRQNPCNLQPTGVQRLASNAGHSDPTARSIASSKAARPSQPTGVPRPHPWLLMGVQACRLPTPKRSKPSKPSKPSQPPKRQNPCNLQPTGVQRLASNAGHSDPTARSIASSKAARPSQPTGVPRPHPWLLMGVQACRLAAPKRSKPSKPSQPPKRQNPCNLQPTGVQRLASNAGHSDPTARSIASSKAARPSQPTGVPRPHPWLLMGVQACRLPAPKRSKPSKPSQPPKTSKPLQPSANRRPEACLQRRPQRPHGQIHCFFQGRQAFAANRRPKATSMASYGRPSLPFASP